MGKDREVTEVKVEEELSEEVLEKVSGGASETDDVALGDVAGSVCVAKRKR